jgi:hypothetical protein
MKEGKEEGRKVGREVEREGQKEGGRKGGRKEESYRMLSFILKLDILSKFQKCKIG